MILQINPRRQALISKPLISGLQVSVCSGRVDEPDTKRSSFLISRTDNMKITQKESNCPSKMVNKFRQSQRKSKKFLGIAVGGLTTGELYPESRTEEIVSSNPVPSTAGDVVVAPPRYTRD